MQAERAGTLFWFVFGLVSIYGSIQLGVGTLREPGSGFFSFLAGGFISLMAVIVFIQSFLRRRGIRVKLSALWGGLMWYRPLAIGLILVAYILALERIGFLITSLVTLFVLFKIVEKLSWVKATIISVSISAASFLLFNTLLKATLPRGIFGF
jgi:putative tricarboxylic transport membrane protein